MPSLEEIREQISILPNSATLPKREINALPEILWEGEAIQKAAQGFYGMSNGMLVATNKRLIFIDKGIVKLKVESFLYDKISSIEYTTGMLLGNIIFYASGNKAKIENMQKESAKDIAEFIREYIQKENTINEQSNSENNNNDKGLANELEKLFDLKERGIISEEEFKAMKEKIIQKL